MAQMHKYQTFRPSQEQKEFILMYELQIEGHFLQVILLFCGHISLTRYLLGLNPNK